MALKLGIKLIILNESVMNLQELKLPSEQKRAASDPRRVSLLALNVARRKKLLPTALQLKAELQQSCLTCVYCMCSSQCNYFENATACSKRTLKTQL
jgi:hypothetical protein